MSEYVLGVSGLYHDSAAALVRDGVVVAAASEERFSRVKHDAALPLQAMAWCLKREGIAAADLSHVVYYEKPLRKFERLMVTQLSAFPASLRAFQRTAVSWLTDKLWVHSALAAALEVEPKKVIFCDHHLSHASSAFYCSPFESAAVLTVDGVGEWATTTLFDADERGIRRLSEIRFPHSLGLAYSAFTAYLGFMVNEGEYKVMGMSAFGQPRFKEQVQRIVRSRGDGSFELDLSCFSFHQSADSSYNRRFEDLFGPARFPGSPFDPESEEGRRYADIAASIQSVCEDCMVDLARALHARTGRSHLCMAGGVTLNAVANYHVLQRAPFEQLFVHPAAGDAGGAVGAALWAYHEVLGRPRRAAFRSPDLGQSYGDGELQATLADLGIRYESLADEQLYERATDDLVKGRVLAWFQGGFEWGPRALGHRSILADPRPPSTALRVNTKIKYREPFRPFAPSVLEGNAERFFDIPDGAEQVLPWMLMVCPVRENGAELLPATTHVDRSARVHVVHKDRSPRFAELLRSFGAASGCPVLLNTSLNLKGEPMVASPMQALRMFYASDLDVLYLGSLRIDGSMRKGRHAHGHDT